MGHLSDCAVHRGPAFLPGPCDCGLNLPVDGSERLRPLLIIGARGGRWTFRQVNVEALVEAEESPAGDGRLITLSIHLKSAHGWPSCGASADCVNFDDPIAVAVVNG